MHVFQIGHYIARARQLLEKKEGNSYTAVPLITPKGFILKYTRGGN
jgi:hypothetical protein